jgi:acetyl/propionyl-CoA carboxylase alpha subunit
MIAKLIVHGEDRTSAIVKMKGALTTFRVSGINTTIPFHRAVLGHADFVENRITTDWVERKFMSNLHRARIR